MRDPAQGDAGFDHESRVVDGDHEALRLWLRLLTCAHLIEASIRARLRESYACTLPRFELMAQLERHPEGLKMGELSRRLMVTGGNVTGITDQLVREALVTREPQPNDRRAFRVRLTPAGEKAFARMAQDQEQWVIDLVSHLPERDRAQLHALLGELKDGLTTQRKRSGRPTAYAARAPV